MKRHPKKPIRKPARNAKTVRTRKQAQTRSKRAIIPVTERDRLAGKWFAKLMALQARLCAPGGCPWDREQTHESLRKFLIEETYEVLGAMESSDAQHFCSGLGVWR